MPMKRNAWAALVVIVAGAAFWAGSEIQRAAYHDRCLDLGGGRNPGNHPICVIDGARAPLQLGPIVISAQEVGRMKHALKLSHPKCGEPDMSHVYRDADGAPVLVAMGLTITFDRQGSAGERIIRIETQ